MQDFDQLLDHYAELTVKVGLNLQPDQSLLIGRMMPESQVSFEAAPFVRKVVAHAYRAGARIVDVHWGDRSLVVTRLKEARKETLSEVPEAWMLPGVIDMIDKGGAVMTIHSPEPDLMNNVDVQDLSTVLNAYYSLNKPLLERITGGTPNWVVVCAATPTWATKLFPNVSKEAAYEKLWDAIFDICRVRNDDPISVWREHIRNLHARSDYLNAKAYKTLLYHGPGTELAVGLPKGHIWHSGSLATKSGLEFLANIPTEEVFTLPHCDRLDGTVHSSLALN
ncbi:MAG: aminopeptidase, partial [Anaerolineae bacterium]|nr:aminopeptidase [Anaerolineae bacterium]